MERRGRDGSFKMSLLFPSFEIAINGSLILGIELFHHVHKVVHLLRSAATRTPTFLWQIERSRRLIWVAEDGDGNID